MSSEDDFTRAAARLGALRPMTKPHLQRVIAHLSEGRLDQAQVELDARLKRAPDDADAISLSAQAAVRRGRRGEAVALLERALALAPDFELARFNRADLLVKLSRFEEALAELDILIARDPRNALYRQLKANALEAIGENEASLAVCEELARENPSRAESWVSLGHALRAAGREKESEAAYRKAIARRPSFGLPWWSIANMKFARFGDDDVAAMQREAARPDLGFDDRIHIQFTLGKALEDRRLFDKAFEQYAKANAAMWLRINYDAETLKTGVARNKRLFTREFFAARQGWGCPAPDPIFVVGRQRSGSTLLEQILSSHSEIEGTAELPYISAIASRLDGRETGSSYASDYLRAVEALTADEARALGEQYMQATRAHRKLGRPFFTDKKPANFFHVGLIRLILPNAKIIDARRHPVAAALSLFKHHSSRGNIRLAESGQFFRDYVELMAWFDRVLPGHVHRVIYERMVAEPEAETRKLIAYLGLPFEDSCLRFYETKRTVLTPSSEQVRRPISGEAVDYWRNFEPSLGPLIRALGGALDAYPEVPEELR